PAGVDGRHRPPQPPRRVDRRRLYAAGGPRPRLRRLGHRRGGAADLRRGPDHGLPVHRPAQPGVEPLLRQDRLPPGMHVRALRAAIGGNMSERKLQGKVAVVTGGARGLGRGYALRLAGLGADIAIIDRNLKAAEVYEFERAALTAGTVMAECEAEGVRAIGLEADLARRETAFPAVDEVVRRLGRSDVAVCNAGGGTVRFADERDEPGANEARDEMTTGTPADCPEEMLARVLDINLKTTMYTCMAVAPHMKRQRSGKI